MNEKTYYLRISSTTTKCGCRGWRYRMETGKTKKEVKERYKYRGRVEWIYTVEELNEKFTPANVMRIMLEAL